MVHSYVNKYSTFSTIEVVTELKKGHDEFIEKMIPEIEHHFMILPSKIEKMNHMVLAVCFKKFIDFRNELTKHIDFEEKFVFPYLVDGVINNLSECILTFVESHENHEEHLKELIHDITQNLMQLNYLMSYRVLLIKLTNLLERLEFHAQQEHYLFEQFFLQNNFMY